jgi:hypothetical protein
MRWSLGGSINYRSESFSNFGENNMFLLDERVLVDVRAGLIGPSGNWGVQLYGRNVTDEHYYIQRSRLTDRPPYAPEFTQKLVIASQRLKLANAPLRRVERVAPARERKNRVIDAADLLILAIGDDCSPAVHLPESAERPRAA